MKLINALLTIAITVMVAALAMQGRFELATLAFVAGGAITFGLNHTPQSRAAGDCFANTPLRTRRLPRPC